LTTFRTPYVTYTTGMHQLKRKHGLGTFMCTLAQDEPGDYAFACYKLEFHLGIIDFSELLQSFQSDVAIKHET